MAVVQWLEQGAHTRALRQITRPLRNGIDAIVDESVISVEVRVTHNNLDNKHAPRIITEGRRSTAAVAAPCRIKTYLPRLPNPQRVNPGITRVRRLRRSKTVSALATAVRGLIKARHLDHSRLHHQRRSARDRYLRPLPEPPEAVRATASACPCIQALWRIRC